MMRHLLWMISLLVFLQNRGLAQSFYAIDTIQVIEIQFAEPNWDYILDTAKAGSDGYHMAQWVKINGVQYDSVGVKYKGNSSYNANNSKNPFHIELDHFIQQDYQGYKDIKLSNGWRDPCFVREALMYSIIQNYMYAPKANFAQVYVNGQLIGLYTNVEAVNKTFLQDRFLSNTNSFVYADNGGCGLVYVGNDSNLYNTPYTLKSDYGYADLMGLCDSLANNITKIETVLDVDRSLWMLAITNAFVILDSYLGGSRHNYYIYEDHNGRFNPIIWDLNNAFGSFNKLYAQTPLSLNQLQTLPITAHINDAQWPLIKNLLAIPTYKRMYVAHMKTIVSEMLSSNNYYTYAQYLQGIIDTAYQSDPNAYFTYSQFIANLNNDIPSGPNPIPGLTNLMNTRIPFLNASAEFQQVAPTISNVHPSDTFPPINSTVYILAQVSNATTVLCKWRTSVMGKFTSVPMYDDGLHGDGGAGDGLYGATLTISTPEIHYFVYAENPNAGLFSPQRAEHEWYTLSSNFPMVSPGALVINELSALNNSIQQNGQGNFSDWIELYNTTNNTLYLDNIYLSDDYLDPLKWPIPVNTLIQPNGYTMIWADEDAFPGELHCGFNLAGSGEKLILSYANGSIIDSVTFPQQSQDITYGRYPNGSGPFTFLSPTFNGSNSPLGIAEYGDPRKFMVYPNPFRRQTTVSKSEPMVNARLMVFNPLGQVVFALDNIYGKHATIHNREWPAGLYFLLVVQDNQPIGYEKIVVME